MEKRWQILFDGLLFDWLTDDAMWPQNRTVKMFREWIDIEVHSMVWDLADEMLQVEDWGGDGAEQGAENPNINLH